MKAAKLLGTDKAMARVIGIYPIHSAVSLNTGERGLVTRVDWHQPLKPTVTVRYNARLMPLAKSYPVDPMNSGKIESYSY